MHYYIDGYNLLFFLKEAENQLKESREALIEELCHKLKETQLDITIVFDSTYQWGESSRGHKHNLEIQYTAEGETADEFIISEVAESVASQEVVITSDKRLAWKVKNLGAKTQSVAEFVAWLNKIWKKKPKLNIPKKEISPAPLREIPTEDKRWLKIFEEKLGEEGVVSHVQENAVDDNERWLKIFEEKLNHK